MTRAAWCRTLLAVHRWTALAAACLVLLYAVTGIAMVHPGAFRLGGGARDARTVDLAQPADTPEALAAQVARALDLRERPDAPTVAPDGRFRVTFRRPGTQVEAVAAPGATTASVDVRRFDLARRLGELHELRHYEGPWWYRLWAVVVDLAAAALLVFAVSGVALWALLHPDRPGLILLLGSSAYALGSIVWLLLAA